MNSRKLWSVGLCTVAVLGLVFAASLTGCAEQNAKPQASAQKSNCPPAKCTKGQASKQQAQPAPAQKKSDTAKNANANSQQQQMKTQPQNKPPAQSNAAATGKPGACAKSSTKRPPANRATGTPPQQNTQQTKPNPIQKTGSSNK